MPESSNPASAERMDSRVLSLADHYPVVIIGGGINGCGLFRDLCEQGVDCLLIDKGDFCSGASAASSRLIHGGIKYLETGEFRLVRQSAEERNLLLRNAPHYVQPLETVLPVCSHFGGILASVRRFLGLKAPMADRGSIIIGLGLHLYDFFGRQFQSLPRHRMLSRRKALTLLPQLDPRIRGAGVYYEARIAHAERLAVELLIDGLKANPDSRVLSYVHAAGAGAEGITVTDRMGSGRKTVSAAHIVNAGGAWIDQINRSLGLSTTHMGGTKGSHLIVRQDELYTALAGRMIYFGSADGRVNLIYPFMGNVLIGSTDIPESDIDGASCSAGERDYMIGAMREIFPSIVIHTDQIRMTCCGVRPLPAGDLTDPGAISRDHSIAVDTIPGTDTEVLSLIGGKWTTFRGFAEEVADRLLSKMAKPRLRGTQDLAIGGGAGFPRDDQARVRFVTCLAAKTPLSEVRAAVLLSRYGTRAEMFGSSLRSDEHLLISCPSYSVEEIRWICCHEHVVRLTDIVFRRTSIALSGDLTDAVITEVAQIVGNEKGWDAAVMGEEIASTRRAALQQGIRLG